MTPIKAVNDFTSSTAQRGRETAAPTARWWKGHEVGGACG